MLPVNTSGGALAQGDAGPASAIAQLCERLDPKVLGALLQFVRSADGGSLVLVKNDGELMDVRVEDPRPARRARQAKA